jgi:cytosine/adenosine deaminase-related metal-dependent hydrolase
MDKAGTVITGDLLVRDGRIVALGADVRSALAELPAGRADQSIDAAGGLVLPGLVHGHLHLCQTLFRGLAEQSDLIHWLQESIWPLEAAHTEASIAASARLGLLELLRGGVTCVNDMGTVRHTEVIGDVLERSGIRAVFGKALMDRGEGVPDGLRESTREALEGALALVARFHGAGDGRLTVSLAPRFILSCSEELWRDVAASSEDEGLIVHTHIAESPREGRDVAAAVKTTAARYFGEHRVLSRRFVGAHGVWLEDDELALLAQADAALVHCPGSNLKLGSGLARLRRWKDAGIRCGIGSDGAACNNRLDTFHEMSLAAGISRVLDPDRPLESREVLELATRRGAEALGLGPVTGSLEIGKQADVIVVDVQGPHHAPNPTADPYTTVVHAARPDDVRLTMVAGQVLVRDGRYLTLDAERVLAEARAEARGVLARQMAAR